MCLFMVDKVTPHDYGEKLKMKEYRNAKKNMDFSAGDSVRIIHELQGLSQNQLAVLTGILQSTLSRSRITELI